MVNQDLVHEDTHMVSMNRKERLLLAIVGVVMAFLGGFVFMMADSRQGLLAGIVLLLWSNNIGTRVVYGNQRSEVQTGDQRPQLGREHVHRGMEGSKTTSPE